MSIEDRKTRILNAIEKFKKDVEEYISTESQIEQKTGDVKSKKEELSKIAYKERIKEIAEEVLFPGEQKDSSQTRKMEEEIKTLEAEIVSLQDKLNNLRTLLTHTMYTLPIPADLNKCKLEGDKTIFPFFEDAKLGETVIDIMRKLLKMKELEFQGVKILSDKVIIDSSSIDEGITKLASGIKTYRLKLGEILKAYEQIDAMVERAMKSDLYSRILRTLLIEKKMSISDIAKKLDENERRVYDACYNLTRDQWTPNPIERTNSGEWSLTISGEILANRLLEKYHTKTELETARTA